MVPVRADVADLGELSQRIGTNETKIALERRASAERYVRCNSDEFTVEISQS